METRCPVSCWLHSKLFVVVHLGCSYLQISSNLKPTLTFLSPLSLSVGITVATVKTNLIIIQVMFFGISVHLPANFDGICSTHSRPAQHISCQTAELGSVITPGVQLGTRLRRLPRDLLEICSSHQSCSLSLRNQSWLGLNHVLLLWWLDHAMIRDNNRLQWKFATSTTACGGE